MRCSLTINNKYNNGCIFSDKNLSLPVVAEARRVRDVPIDALFYDYKYCKRRRNTTLFHCFHLTKI